MASFNADPFFNQPADIGAGEPDNPLAQIDESMANIMDSLQFSNDEVHLPWDSEGKLTAFSETLGAPDLDTPLWQFQTTPFTCAVMAQRGIIEAYTGESISEAQLVYEATSNGWLTDNGMSPSDVGRLLELHGIACHECTGATVEDLMRELAQGHKVIVGVDSREIWKEPHPLDDFIHNSADHAIWVTGINNNDPANPRVIINDSGSPDGAGKEYALSRFVDAWEDSGFFYVSTDHPPANLQQLASGFDSDEGVFPEMTSFMAKHAPQDAEYYVDLMRDSFPAGMPDEEILRILKEVQRAGGDLDEIHKCDLLVEKILKHPYDPQGYLDDLHSDPRTKDVVYRAGTCHHCGGYGYTTWPSSGSRERCWFCDGSGVAM